MTIQKKLASLKAIISGYGSCLVAFSGGQDSAFLLKICSMVLPKDKLLAVTAFSAAYPEIELQKAKALAEDIGARHKVIKTRELDNKNFISNSVKRCYFCKKELFTRLISIAGRNKLRFVLDAGNISDKNDYRPGNIAKRKLKIKSPLSEAGFNKVDIRKASRSLGLVTWNKPSLACLASRVPYGTKITAGLLKRIAGGEEYLTGLGFRQVRLRHYNGLCRIEVGKGDIRRLLNKREAITARLKTLGYNYITVDLEGYRTGSLNEVINQ
ncbi:ATP-dependent sacrificial sulfur transferase LarE [bacterium]|nr:MAG: ATP-dependent sacrificial sulfur transferase LarE [bacterium]